MNRESPDIARLLETLADHDVEYVLAGSVAAEAWGADVGTPGDLDIIPATDERNLRKLADAMSVLEAEPFPHTGEWQSSPGGFTWYEFDPDDPRRSTAPSAPDPMNPATFDSLFATRYGAFDVVPVISGIFKDVAPRSTRLTTHGVKNVRVMSIEDLLRHLTIPRREKDAARVAYLRGQQFRR